MIPPVLPTYARAPLSFVAGEGAWLIEESGERYLDLGAGIAVTLLGHANPALVAALEAQARKLWHTSNLYRIPNQEALAERLVAATFADTVFVTNSGTEAIECAIKMARKHFDHAGQPERNRIITFEGAFHGRSYGAISAAGLGEDGQGLRAGAAGLRPPAVLRPRRRSAAAIGPETAAILVEPIQGEGGIRALSRDDLRGLRALCDETGTLLILDEVQCGMGRTGTAVPPRVGRDHPRHHDGRQGHRRRLPARRLPRHRAGGRGHDRSAPTARPTAATRSPAPSACAVMDVGDRARASSTTSAASPGGCARGSRAWSPRTRTCSRRCAARG